MKHRRKLYYNIIVCIIFFLGFTIIDRFNLSWTAYIFIVIFGMLFDFIWD
jgi:hypothetical protein